MVVDTSWARLRAPLGDEELCTRLLQVLSEGIEEMYGVLRVSDANVLDIGAFMGETSVFFAAQGARRVYGYEPVEKYYRVALDNIEWNGLAQRITVFNKAVWGYRTRLRLGLQGKAQG